MKNKYYNILELGTQEHQMHSPSSPMWMKPLWRSSRILNHVLCSLGVKIQKFHLRSRGARSMFRGRWISRGMGSAARFSTLSFGGGWSRRGILMLWWESRGRTASRPLSRAWTRMWRVSGSSSDSSKVFLSFPIRSVLKLHYSGWKVQKTLSWRQTFPSMTMIPLLSLGQATTSGQWIILR